MALFVSGIGSLGAQTKPYMNRLRKIVAYAIGDAYVALFYGDINPMKRFEIRTAFDVSTRTTDEGRVIFTNEESISGLLKDNGYKPLEKGQLLRIALHAAKTDKILSQMQGSGFDATRGGIGYYVKDAFVEYPQEFVPLNFVEEAQSVAEAEAQMKEAEMNRRFGIRPPEIILNDPRQERKTLHGWRRRR